MAVFATNQDVGGLVITQMGWFYCVMGLNYFWYRKLFFKLKYLNTYLNLREIMDLKFESYTIKKKVFATSGKITMIRCILKENTFFYLKCRI